MALEIKPAPVLSGKAAEDFYKSLAHSKESKPSEEVKKITNEVREYLATNRHYKIFLF